MSESNETEILDINLQVTRMELDVIVMALQNAKKRSDDRLAKMIMSKTVPMELIEESSKALKLVIDNLMEQIQEQAPWILARLDQVQMRMRDFKRGAINPNDLP